MGNTLSGISELFRHGSNEQKEPGTPLFHSNVVTDPLLQPDYVSRQELNHINSDLSQSICQLDNRVNILGNAGALMSPFKRELNSFYSVVNEQSEVNLEDHERMHDLLCQLQQEMCNLRKEVSFLRQEKHHEKYHAKNLAELNFNWDHSGENFHDIPTSPPTSPPTTSPPTSPTPHGSPTSETTLSPSTPSARHTNSPVDEDETERNSPSLSVKEFLELEKKLNTLEPLSSEPLS